MGILTPDGPVATSQGGTVYVKRFGDLSRFIWGGECVYIGDITDERGGLNITTRANAREGGLRRDGVLVDPPGNVSTSLSMKRLRGDKLKTWLKSCFWIFDKRTQCNDFDDPTAWQEIERVYRAKVGTRTTTPGTSIADSNAEGMVNFDITALESVDIYRAHIESAVPEATQFLATCVDACHGDRCVNCGDSQTDSVYVAGTKAVAMGSPFVLVNEDGGDPDAWAAISITDWSGDITGIACLGQWGIAVGNTDDEIIYTRDRFTSWVVYSSAAFTANAPYAVDASSQTFAVAVGDGGYIYISRDGGASWETSSAGNVTAQVLRGVKIADANHQIIYAWSNVADVIVKSENGGETWFAITGTGTGGAGIFSLGVHPDDPNILIAGTDNGELYESLDGGETWTEQADLTGATTIANVNIVDIQPAGGGVWFAAVTEDAPAAFSRIYVNYEDGAGAAWEYFNPIDGQEYEAAEALTAIATVGPNRCVGVGGDGAAAAVACLLS